MNQLNNVELPLIEFSFDTNFFVKLKNGMRFSLAEEMIPQLELIIPKAIDEKCKEHNAEPYIVYCHDCKKHLCSKCLENPFHGSHNKETLIKDLNIGQITQSLEKAQNHINKDLLDVKKHFMKNIMKKINELEFAYKKCRIYNLSTLTFVKMLIESYSLSSPNYYVKENVRKHTNFDFSCFQMDETEKENITELEDVIQFYKNFIIISKPTKNIEEEKEEIISRRSSCVSMFSTGIKIVSV